MIDLLKVLDEVRAKIIKCRGTHKNLSEQNTKAALIDPVLRALGWPVGNLDEVSQEFRLKSSDNPVDYALFVVGCNIPILLVEAKALGQSLDKWAHQIMGYAGTCGVTWVVITNGDEYRIYNATVPVPFDQKLFRRVRLTNPDDPTEDTLALLTKGRADDLDAQWQIHFADSQVHYALKKLFSPTPEFDSVLLSFVEKYVKGLAPEDIKSSLARLKVSFEFLSGPATTGGNKPPKPPFDKGYVEFWKPIRREGLFAGKPNHKAYIGKAVRPRIKFRLIVHNHTSRVELLFYGENRQERRKKALELFPAAKYQHKLRVSQQRDCVRFGVLDKGIQDHGQWAEIREKLTQLGTDIYHKLSNSGI